MGSKKAANNNADRGERAVRAMGLEYTDEISADISDLLTDLRHLCDREGLDFAALDSWACKNYEIEVEQETPEVAG